MRQASANTSERNPEKRRVMLFLFGIPLMLMALLTGIVVIGLYFVERGESKTASQWIGSLTLLVVTISIVALLAGFWRLYFSVRYLQIPIWRWIASGLRGEPSHLQAVLAIPHDIAKAERERSRGQRICMWTGGVCAIVGAILMINDVVWRWIFTIRGERHVGSVPFIFFWSGVVMFALGVCLIRIAMPKNAQRKSANV